jgi:hypothetical protein
LALIRTCEVFIDALSNNWLQSKPSPSELRCAWVLNRPILPVLIGGVDSMRVNPLAALQIIDYGNPTVDDGIRLVTAAHALRNKPVPLPDGDRVAHPRRPPIIPEIRPPCGPGADAGERAVGALPSSKHAAMKPLRSTPATSRQLRSQIRNSAGSPPLATVLICSTQYQEPQLHFWRGTRSSSTS